MNFLNLINIHSILCLSSPMTSEQRSGNSNLVIFSIKDRDFFGITNTFLSECSISFGEIDQNNRREQKHLKLSRPTMAGQWALNPLSFPITYWQLDCFSIFFLIFRYHSVDCDFIRALELRQDDKRAKDFIKKIKKIVS